MKLLYVFFGLMFLISGAAKAQPAKGNWLIAGSTNLIGNSHQFGTASLTPNNNLGLYRGKYKLYLNGNEIYTINSSVFNLTPSFGKMLTNNSMLGLSTGISHMTRKIEGRDSNSNTFIAWTPFFRYYGRKQGGVYPYLELKAGGSWIFYNDASDYNTILGAKVALSYFMNSKIALDIFADYNYALNKIYGNSGVFGLGVGFSLFK